MIGDHSEKMCFDVSSQLFYAPENTYEFKLAYAIVPPWKADCLTYVHYRMLNPVIVYLGKYKTQHPAASVALDCKGFCEVGACEHRSCGKSGF